MAAAEEEAAIQVAVVWKTAMSEQQQLWEGEVDFKEAVACGILNAILGDVVDTLGIQGKAVSEGGNKTFKFSDMTESEIIKIVEEYRKKAPIEIPNIAKYKAKSMADGYEQISYKWNDGTYKYEVRWHTRTSGAPEGQGNTWVIQRTIPGNGGQKPSIQILIGENEWVEGWKWYDAINARKNGIATQEQIELLDKGHWKE